MADSPETTAQAPTPGEGGTEVDPNVNVDEQEDSVLEQLLGDPSEDDLADGYEAFDKAESEPETEPEPQPEPEPAKAEDDTPPGDDDSDEYRLALATLRRDGWTKDDLKGVPAETLIRLADRRSKVQNDTDDAYAELVELRSRVKPAGERTASENEAEATPPHDERLKDHAKALADRLALGDEGAADLATLLSESQKPLLQDLDSANRRAAAAEKGLARVEGELARKSLEKRFPQVKDASSDEFKRVLARMNTLQRSGDYESVAQLMEDSILIEFRDDLKAEAKSAQANLRKARANGQATTAPPRARDKQGRFVDNLEGKSVEEREDAILDLLEEDNPETYMERILEARRIGGRNI